MIKKLNQAKIKFRETFNHWKWQLAPILVAGVLYGIGRYTSADVTPLGWHDFNDDGREDPIVAFPLKGTNRSLVGYLDGANLNKSSTKDIKANIIQFTRLNVPTFYGNWNNLNSTYDCVFTRVRDHDNNGTLDLEVYSSSAGLGGDEKVFLDILKC